MGTRSFHELAQLAGAGASFITYADDHSIVELETIARYALNGGGQVTLKRCDSLSLDNLKAIAACGGPGSVVFDFTGTVP